MGSAKHDDRHFAFFNSFAPSPFGSTRAKWFAHTVPTNATTAYISKPAPITNPTFNSTLRWPTAAIEARGDWHKSMNRIQTSLQGYMHRNTRHLYAIDHRLPQRTQRNKAKITKHMNRNDVTYNEWILRWVRRLILSSRSRSILRWICKAWWSPKFSI